MRISQYSNRQQARAMAALGDTRHLSRAEFNTALLAKLVEMFGAK